MLNKNYNIESIKPSPLITERIPQEEKTEEARAVGGNGKSQGEGPEQVEEFQQQSFR